MSENEIKIFNSGLHRDRSVRMDTGQKQLQASPVVAFAPAFPSPPLPLLPSSPSWILQIGWYHCSIAVALLLTRLSLRD